jgi:hypothetical protein
MADCYIRDDSHLVELKISKIISRQLDKILKPKPLVACLSYLNAARYVLVHTEGGPRIWNGLEATRAAAQNTGVNSFNAI